MNLTPFERETVVNFSDESDLCTIYTCSKPVMNKLNKLCVKFPNTYKLVLEDPLSKTYETKKKFISFRSPKTISNEHREKLKLNVQKNKKLIDGVYMIHISNLSFSFMVFVIKFLYNYMS